MTTLAELNGDATEIEETYGLGRIEWAGEDGITIPTIVWSDNLRFHMGLLDDDETFEDPTFEEDPTDSNSPDGHFTQRVENKLQRLLGDDFKCAVQWSDMDPDVDNAGEENEIEYYFLEFNVWPTDDSVFTPDMEEEKAEEYLWDAIATLFNVTDPGTFGSEYLFSGLARKKESTV